MGLLWEILQSDTLEDRVAYLEEHLQKTQDTIRNVIRKLEEIHDKDIDGDGKVG